MEFCYCSNCNKETGHKRALSWGTFFAFLLTGGLWFLAIPFYPKRCIVCGHELSSSQAESIIRGTNKIKQRREISYQTTSEFFWVLVLIFVALLLMVIVDVAFTYAKPKIYDDAIITRVVSVYDGDTFRADIKGHPDISGKNMPIRIYGIDTPEIRGEKNPKIKVLAQKAKEFVIKRFKEGRVMILKRTSRGKYFRIIAEVWIDGINLGNELIKAKLAKSYLGGKRQKWE